MKAGKFPLLYPTGSFAALLFVLGAMWYAASNQNSPAVYLLLFGLTAVFLVSIPQTLLNLADVTIAPESAKPAFAGEEVSLPVEIMNCSRTTRRGIELVLPGSGGERKRVDYIPAGKAARVTLRFPAGHRGERGVGTFRLTRIYPLGFVRVLKGSPPRKLTWCIQSRRAIPGSQCIVRVHRIAGHKRSLAKAMISQESAPMCRANLNVTSIGEPWRAGSRS